MPKKKRSFRISGVILCFLILILLLTTAVCKEEKTGNKGNAPGIEGGTTSSQPQAQAPESEKDPFTEAKKAIFRKDWLKAKSYLEKVGPQDPNYVLALHNLGIIHEKLSDPAKSVSCYEKILEIDPKNADAHANLGWSFFLEGKYQESIKESHMALTYNPNLITALFNLGLAHAAYENYASAIEMYSRAAAQDSKKTEIKTAIEDLQRFVDTKPEAQAARLCLAFLFRSTGDYKREKEELGKLLATAPTGKLREDAQKRLEELAKVPDTGNPSER